MAYHAPGLFAACVYADSAEGASKIVYLAATGFEPYRPAGHFPAVVRRD